MLQYQVSDLTDQIKKIIEKGFPGLIMVHGEAVECFKSAGGHFYFSLKDEGAKIKSVYFRNAIRPDSFLPKNGDKVSAIGELQLYPADGTYQLMIRKVVYSTQGEFWKRFEETKKKLEAEGFFRSETKRVLPFYPKRIALLTAPTGAAVKDFIVTSRNAGGLFDIHLWPIPVQGKDFADKIAAEIRRAGEKTDLYDVLVLTRGGGSTEDLAVFNEESVARALKGCKVPTVSAIGHEQDITICDFVADERVATPTAAAERLSIKFKQAVSNLDSWINQVLRLLRWRMENANLAFEKLSVNLQAKGPAYFLSTEKLRYQSANDKLAQNFKTHIAEKRHRLELLLSKLEMGNPERLLDMGYAMVTKNNGDVVTDVSQVTLDDELTINIKNGVINAFVTGKKNGRICDG